MFNKEQKLTGWGNYPKIVTSLKNYSPEQITKPSIYRGLGKSYADQAISENGQTISTLGNNRILSLENGLVEVESGISIRELMHALIPKGYMVGVCAGTEYITVGGAIANNVHGKGHHVDGAFINTVKSFCLITPSGQELECSREKNEPIFWACAGGCGLLGYISKASIWLKPIKSAYFNTRSHKASNFQEMFHLLDTEGLKAHYSVGWIDTTKNNYPGVLVCGEHHEPENDGIDWLMVDTKEPKTLPNLVPNGLLNQTTTSILNRVINYKQIKTDGLVHYQPFFFPLDILKNWNIGYGPNGFIQYQFVIPNKDALKNMELILSAIKKAKCIPFLNVIKRFGTCDSRFLSFPIEGYTLALDFAVSKKVLQMSKHLNKLVALMGGRVYLAKDATLDASSFGQMYPELKAFLELKKELDPDGILQSAQSQRLKMG